MAEPEPPPHEQSDGRRGNSAPAGRRTPFNIAIVDDRLAQQAYQFLVDSVESTADAEANADYAREWCKTVLAAGIAFSDAKSADRREAEARASPEYASAVERSRDAVRQQLLLRLKRQNAQTAIEIWRTLQSNLRQVR
jgi:hypothetical protein